MLCLRCQSAFERCSMCWLFSLHQQTNTTHSERRLWAATAAIYHAQTHTHTTTTALAEMEFVWWQFRDDAHKTNPHTHKGIQRHKTHSLIARQAHPGCACKGVSTGCKAKALKWQKTVAYGSCSCTHKVQREGKGCGKQDATHNAVVLLTVAQVCGQAHVCQEH